MKKWTTMKTHKFYCFLSETTTRSVNKTNRTTANGNFLTIESNSTLINVQFTNQYNIISMAIQV